MHQARQAVCQSKTCSSVGVNVNGRGWPVLDDDEAFRKFPRRERRWWIGRFCFCGRRRLAWRAPAVSRRASRRA